MVSLHILVSTSSDRQSTPSQDVLLFRLIRLQQQRRALRTTAAVEDIAE